MKKNLKNRGFGLLEIIIVVAIISFTLTALAGMGNYALKISNQLKNNVIATNLAAEALETAKAVKNEDWNLLAALTEDAPYHPVKSGSPQKWVLVAGAETVFSLLGGRRSRRISEAMSKHRMTEQSKADVNESVDLIAEFKQQLAQLEKSRQQAQDEAETRWGNSVNNITEIAILPKKTDVYVSLFGVAWMPYYQATSGDQMVELPAFQ